MTRSREQDWHRRGWRGPYEPVRLGLGGTGAGAAIAGGQVAMITAHGDPYDPDDPGTPGDPDIHRIWVHTAKLVTFTGHNPAANGRNLIVGDTEIQVSSIVPGGWFQVGQIIVAQNIGGYYKSWCDGFLGKVTKTAPTGPPPGRVEVIPFDGELGFFFNDPDRLTFYTGSPVEIAQIFPGSELRFGEPVYAKYIGYETNGRWMAWNQYNLFGEPTDSDYANAEPTGDEVCPISDPGIPVTAPTDDTLDSLVTIE